MRDTYDDSGTVNLPTPQPKSIKIQFLSKGTVFRIRVTQLAILRVSSVRYDLNACAYPIVLTVLSLNLGVYL